MIAIETLRGFVEGGRRWKGSIECTCPCQSAAGTSHPMADPAIGNFLAATTLIGNVKRNRPRGRRPRANGTKAAGRPVTHRRGVSKRVEPDAGNLVMLRISLRVLKPLRCSSRTAEAVDIITTKENLPYLSSSSSSYTISHLTTSPERDS